MERRIVDLGFENLGLNKDAFQQIQKAFVGHGVKVPHTRWKLRFVYPHAIVELADPEDIITLPSYWKEGVLVLNNEFKPIWIGKRVRINGESTITT